MIQAIGGRYLFCTLQPACTRVLCKRSLRFFWMQSHANCTLWYLYHVYVEKMCRRAVRLILRVFPRHGGGGGGSNPHLGSFVCLSCSGVAEYLFCQCLMMPNACLVGQADMIAADGVSCQPEQHPFTKPERTTSPK